MRSWEDKPIATLRQHGSCTDNVSPSITYVPYRLPACTSPRKTPVAGPRGVHESEHAWSPRHAPTHSRDQVNPTLGADSTTRELWDSDPAALHVFESRGDQDEDEKPSSLRDETRSRYPQCARFFPPPRRPARSPGRKNNAALRPRENSSCRVTYELWKAGSSAGAVAWSTPTSGERSPVRVGGYLPIQLTLSRHSCAPVGIEIATIHPRN